MVPTEVTAGRQRVQSPGFYINLDYRVIHEDEALLVLDKPAPLAVHPVGAYAELNLHSLLRKDPRWSGTDIRFLHRLDAETSGVICAAKTPEAARHVGLEFLNGRVEKKYRALVFGIPQKGEGEIDFRLGYDEGSGFQTVRVRDDAEGEEAVTKYRVLWAVDGYSCVELQPLTGRTHQIRAHLAMIGHPVVGDKIYVNLDFFRQYVVGGLNDAMLEHLKLPRLALHAVSLRFKHPATREEAEFNSPAPHFLLQIP